MYYCNIPRLVLIVLYFLQNVNSFLRVPYNFYKFVSIAKIQHLFFVQIVQFFVFPSNNNALTLI